jgi:hypothetical protein
MALIVSPQQRKKKEAKIGLGANSGLVTRQI